MNNKTDSSSNEEGQSSGISSMSDDAPSIENGSSYQGYNTPESFDLYADDSYDVRLENGQKEGYVMPRNDDKNPRYPVTQKASDFTHNVTSNGPVQNDLKPTMAQQNSLKSPGFDHSLLGIIHGNGYQANPQLYSPFADANRGYFLDSDLETIEEESSVIESDFDDRSSIGPDRKRLASEILQARKHSRNESASSMLSSSVRSSVTSLTTASDDERSSSTLSSVSPKLSSDRSTPYNDRSTDSEPTTPRQHIHKGKTNGYEIGGIDPNAQQKIVYAKCLSPQEQPRRIHKTSTKSRQNQQVVNSHNGVHETHGSSSRRSHHNVTPRHSKSELTISDMFAAVRHGDVKMLNKFSPTEQSETVDEKGNTILHAAAISGHLQCVQLLASGSCSHAVALLNDDLMTPAALSVQYGHLCCVQWLVQNTVANEELIVSSRQASIDGSNMRPPLAHVAARYNQDVVLDWLCEEMSKENFSVDSADHHSSTAVHEAAAHGHLKSLQTLVGRGASVTVLNSHGDTPGQVADKNGHDLCVGYLVVVETCMSLAQQLITMKLENEGIKKENNGLRTQLQSMHNARIAQAKESVEERIKATLQNLSPYEEDNEEHRFHTPIKLNREEPVKIQPQLSQNLFLQKPDITISPQPNFETNLSNDKKPPLQKQTSVTNQKTTHQTTMKQRKENEISTHKTNTEKLQSNEFEETPRRLVSGKKSFNQHIVENSNGNVEPKRTEIPSVRSTVSKVDQDTVDSDNVEIATLTNGFKEQSQNVSNGNKVQEQQGMGQNVKAWEKMAMDEVLRMARDSRYLPSPTISMCTEDSTMESREMMRDRLAEASRWFMVQQTGGKPRIKEPMFPTNRLRPPNPQHGYSNSSNKAIGNTASWVMGVQKSRKENFPHRPAVQTTPHKLTMPQNFVNATNQHFEKLQNEQHISGTQPMKTNTSNNSISHTTSPISPGSPILSISSTSSSCMTERGNTNHYHRPNSAKSSCSTTSTIRSNIFNSSSSSVSNSTATSHDTVVENRHDDSKRRINADPLQKRQTNSIPGSPASDRSRVSSRPASAKKYDQTQEKFHQGTLLMNEEAEVRVTLPQRNNSFLRKVQPSAHPDSPTRDKPESTPVIYPTVITKQTPNQKLSPKLMSLANSPVSPTKHAQSKANDAQMQPTDVVSPSSNHSKETINTGRGYALWKPSARSPVVVKHVDAPVPSVTLEAAPTEQKSKKNKQTSKQPYGGLFSSNSPKSTSKRKATKLFHF